MPAVGPAFTVVPSEVAASSDGLLVSVGTPATAKAKAVGEGSEGVVSSGLGKRCSGDAIAGCGVVVSALGGMRVRYVRATGTRVPTAGLARLVLSCVDAEKTAAFYEGLGLSRLVGGKQLGVALQAAEDPQPDPAIVLGSAGAAAALELRQGTASIGIGRLVVSVPTSAADKAADAPAQLRDPDGRLVELILG
eukprot:gnl/TRDRNA2_/TRDRNA2_88990_c1_seq1.p1 gnl/TRDRNA2_/TRDRNA2_88990_c1~~gnl/TRDRNA2_/TRDRNA2_88990_c1_seq1.p1  ORF type:complete len:212 (+),score=33.55 gnl/TRDRNA2_/TRDRNA2_88990_c1_seq1:60-638(+)